MEDAYTTVPYLIEVPLPAELEGERIPPRIAPHLSPTPSENADSDGEGVAERQDSSNSNSTSMGSRAAPAMLEVLHFFGVFDGHGGAEAALHCAQTLHERIAESLLMAAEQSKAANMSGAAPSGVPPVSLTAQLNEAPMQRGVVACNCGTSGCACAASEDMQPTLSEDAAAASGMDRDGSSGSDSSFLDRVADEEADAHVQLEGVACSAAEIESALTDAFCKTDEEFGKADNAALVGTTAVVCLVGSRQLYVANCGDSRAVLCRNGVAIPLSDDHKPAREDETARVEAAGGQILFWNGVRVMGVLAVSRAIGDHCLRPFVIAKPEVCRNLISFLLLPCM
jgi:serine/threonine protein phosphatase PrpC